MWGIWMVLMESVQEEEGKKRDRENEIVFHQSRKTKIHITDANKRASNQRMLYLHTDSFYYVYCLPQGIVFVLFNNQKCFMFIKTGIINE